MLRSRRNKITWIFARTLMVSVTLLIFLISHAKAMIGREGSVLYVSDTGKFIFIDLDQGEVRRGELVEVYRGSELIATGLIKKVMEDMSEASIGKARGSVNIGDKIVISGSKKDLSMEKPAPTEKKAGRSRPKKKTVSLSRERPAPRKRKITQPVESYGDARVEQLEDELHTLQESAKYAVGTLKGELQALSEEKEETESRLKSEVASLKTELKTLKNSQENNISYLEDQLADMEHSKNATIARLENNLAGLEKTRRETISNLKKKLRKLSKEKSKNESTLKTELNYLKDREEILEEKFKASERSRKSTERTLTSQLESLEKSRENIIALNKKLLSLQDEKAKMESILNAEIASLRDREEVLAERLRGYPGRARTRIPRMRQPGKEAPLTETERETLARLKREIQTLKSKRIRAEAARSGKSPYLEGELKLLEKERRDMELRLAALRKTSEEAMSKRDEEIISLRDGRSKMEADLNREIVTLRKKLKHAESSKESAESRLSDFESRFSALREGRSKAELDLKNKLANLRRENAKMKGVLDGKLKALRKEIETAQKENIEMARGLKKLKQNLKRANEEKRLLESIVDRSMNIAADM